MEIFISTFLGFITSFISWWILFHYLSPKIVFSKEISVLPQEKNKIDSSKKIYHYKIINSGIRDIIDVEIIENLAIKSSNPDFLGIWEIISIIKYDEKSLKIPLIHSQSSFTTEAQGQLISIRLNETNEIYKLPNYERFSEKFETSELELGDIFDAYSEVQLRIFVFGTDSFSGRRKLFSKNYTKQSLKIGKFGFGLKFIDFEGKN